MEHRYIIFGYDQYYPFGGANDILDWVSAKEEVLPLVRKYLEDWEYVQVLNIKTKKSRKFSQEYLENGKKN